MLLTETLLVELIALALIPRYRRVGHVMCLSHMFGLSLAWIPNGTLTRRVLYPERPVGIFKECRTSVPLRSSCFLPWRSLSSARDGFRRSAAPSAAGFMTSAAASAAKTTILSCRRPAANPYLALDA